MKDTVVKRSPHKVGDVIKQGTMNDVIKGRKVPSCAGYKVISVTKQTHSSGGYLIELKGMRRFLGNNKVVKQVNIPRSNTVKSEDIKQISKTVPAGNRKMLLIDFLEE